MFSFKCREDWRNCRLCMRNDLLLIPLFELSGELTNLAKTIKEMLQFEVSIEDKYPTYVCCKCSDKLWEFKDFKEKCNVVKINVDAVLFNESNCTSVQRNPFVIKYEAKDVKREVLWAEKEIEYKVPKNDMESHISVFKNLIAKEEEEPQDCNSSTLDNYEVFMESISPETMEEDCKMDIECNIPSSELDEVTLKEEDTREEETHTLDIECNIPSSELDEVTLKEEDAREEETHTLERKILVQSSVPESLIKPPSPPKRCEEKDVEPCYSHVDMGSKHSFHCFREPVGVLLHQQQSEVKSQNVVEIPEINSMIEPENSLDLAMSRETLNGSPSCEERRNVFGEKGSDSKKEGKDIRCMHCNLMFNSHLDLYNHFPIHDDTVTWCCGDCGMKSRFFKDIWKDILSHKEAQKQKEALSTSKPNSNTGKICKVCKKKIPILSSFRLHVLSHSKKNKWVCPHCKKNFSGQESLLTHIECHKKV